MLKPTLLLSAPLFLVLGACQPETPPPPAKGEVCWDVTPTEHSALCTEQRLCLAEERKVTVEDASSAGFVCNRYGAACPVPDSEHIEGNFAVFDYDDPAQTFYISVAFKARIMLGYSLADFGAQLENVQVSWLADRGGSAGSGPAGWMQDSQPKVEFLGYEPPLLHVRVTAEGTNTGTSNPTDPYLCLRSSGPIGAIGKPDICTDVSCLYDADGSDPVTLVADLHVPIQQPAP